MITSQDQIPEINRRFRLQIFNPELAYLMSERHCFVLSGKENVAVAEAIDGRRRTREIMRDLSDQLSEPIILYTILQFRAKGYLEPDSPRPTTRVSIVSFNDRITEKVQASLADMSVEIDGNADTLLVITDDYLNPNLSKFRPDCRWLLFKPTGIPHIGPFFDSDEGPCPSCLSFWIRQNRPVDEFVRRFNDSPYQALPQAVDPAAMETACALAVKKLTLRQYDMRKQLIRLDPDTLQIEQHHVTRRLQCPGCGTPDWMRKQARQPIQLQRITKDRENTAGGSRRDPPEKTYERLKHLVSPVTGAVSYLHPMPTRNTGLRHVYISGYFICPREMSTGNPFDKIAAGKGATRRQAKTSALCEAIERFSAVYQGDEPRIRGSMRSLKEDCIHFNELQLFSEKQYRDRELINSTTNDHRKQVPLPFTENSVVDWTPAWSLTRNRHRYVPLAYCFNEVPPESGLAFGIHNPNGSAAGTCIEEAILQGLLELIERDGVAIWWYNGLKRPGIDLQSFGEPYFDALLNDYDKMGWDLWALDLTHDLGIPVCAALARCRAEDRWSIGFGCHPSARLAVQRALTEVNQLLDPTGDAPAPWDGERLADSDFLKPATEGLHAAGNMPDRERGNLHDDLQTCMIRLAAADLETLVVNKTRPDLDLSVVQVIVPGLRHFWPRFGSGRLYDVPRKLGLGTCKSSQIPRNIVPLFL